MQNLVQVLKDFIIFATCKSEHSVAFWFIWIWLFVFLNSKKILKFVFWKIHFFIKEPELKHKIIAKVILPLRLLIILIAITPFTDLIPGKIGVMFENLIDFSLAIMLVHFFIQIFNEFFFGWYLPIHKGTILPNVISFILLGALYLVFSLLFMDWLLGINVWPLLATSTVFTAIVGLSLQDTFRNLFAGLTISLSKPFRIGDWIMFNASGGHNHIGQVVEIGWRITKIRNLDFNYVVIPNEQFTSSTLVNFNMPSTNHAKTINFPISLHAELNHIIPVLETAATSIKGVQEEPKPEASIEVVNIDHINVRLRFWLNEFDDADNITGRVIEVCFKKLGELKALTTSSGDVI